MLPTRSGVGLVAVLAVLVVNAGCLQSTHQIPHGELMRLAQLPPEQRGERVRVVQEMGGEQPPPADPVTDDTGVEVVVVSDVDVDGHHHGHGGQDHGGHGHDGQGHDDHGGIAKDSKAAAIAMFAIAVAAVVILAVEEGVRYDGWVQLHPMHPVHLWGPGGYAVVPLAQLDPDTARWATRAVVRPSEGPWHPLGRAPFDRAGWTYTVLLGAGELVSGDGSLGVGTSGRVQLGYFPSHALGVQLDWGWAYRDNVVGATIFDDRLGLELTFAPLDAGPFHGGVYGGLALASRFEDGVPDGRRDDVAAAGGALLQLSLSTRLAVTARLGVSHAYGDLTRDALVGLSVY